jgi:hypothetical protein
MSMMDRFRIVQGILLITIITTMISILVNDEQSVMAQPGGPGVTPIDPENVTNKTLQGYPTGDKDMSTGIEEENE